MRTYMGAWVHKELLTEQTQGAKGRERCERGKADEEEEEEGEL